MLVKHRHIVLSLNGKKTIGILRQVFIIILTASFCCYICPMSLSSLQVCLKLYFFSINNVLLMIVLCMYSNSEM